MNDVAQCTQFIANSIKVYDIVRSQTFFFIVFSFRSFVRLSFILMIERFHPISCNSKIIFP